MPAEFDDLVNLPTQREFLVNFVGGTAAVTKVFGNDVAIAYVSTGLVDLTWSANQTKPGTFVGLKSFGFHATTAANVKGYSCNAGVYNATTRVLRVSIYDASNNLVDLAALQWLTVTIVFVEGVIGS
jgi:hypothetical protein